MFIPQKRIVTHCEYNIMSFNAIHLNGGRLNDMMFARIKRLCLYHQGTCHFLGKRNPYLSLFPIYIRINLHGGDRIIFPQFYLSHDAIPVSLRLVGHRVRILADIRCFQTIIHTYNYSVILHGFA